MQIHHGLKHFGKKYPKPVLAIGVFDGMHRGHRRIIGRAITLAGSIQGTAMVMTFDPHPVHILRPKIYLPYLISLPYRLLMMAELGVDVCIVVKFTKKFSKLIPEKFIARYLRKIKPSAVVVGDDFRFGRNRRGTLEYLCRAATRYHFDLLVIPSRSRRKKLISSTRIREFIAQGNIAQAQKLLGRPVSLLGRVVRGDTRGRVLGYPTANLTPSPLVILPHGVFVAKVHWQGDIFWGMANVGYRPSFKKPGRVNVEVHIFDFRRNLYGQEIIVEFLHKIRNEKQFWSQEELIKQIKNDEQRARNWLRRKKCLDIKKGFTHLF